MTPLINEMWDIVKIGAETMCAEDSNILFEESKKQAFEASCRKIYDDLLEYMEDKEKPLDRHKMTAIFMISVIRAEVLEGAREDVVFVGNYVLAAEVGFSYLRKALNEKLGEKLKDKMKPIKEFYFPQANSCPTDYFRIFYRNLYFANTNPEWNLNPLDIAERLFLLEYLTLEHNGIQPNVLKEYE
ncbi:hypothetical protein NSB25_13820 [Acetatifactor muris]|jgi:hypothetical protein|uniref:Uncharacterized protein n=1 Tax=Acetatifactor muris TaxID=879566 RepID=A0A2K4ZI92_9FIRM|nr:hypothetical protein [Acetatifactor muris]MCR2048367.1 hypothetical protein [Acetatifactor muris]SOY30171.1 hypothetical protein AMURIS_02894 [Acetatifactor muris]